MKVKIEFYGIARRRAAGVAALTLEFPGPRCVLGDVLRVLADRLPRLGAECIDGTSLRSGYVMNLGGQRFVAGPDTPLNDGDCLLLLSADAGG